MKLKIHNKLVILSKKNENKNCTFTYYLIYINYYCTFFTFIIYYALATVRARFDLNPVQEWT